MKVVESKVMRGPNPFTIHGQVIVNRLQVPEREAGFVSENYYEKLKSLLPGIELDLLGEHSESQMMFGDIAVKLQEMAGMQSELISIRKTEKQNEFIVIYTYEIEEAGIYAAQAAANLSGALIRGEDYDIHEDLQKLEEIHNQLGMGPTTAYLLDEVRRRGIPFRQFEGGSLVRLGYGVNQKKMRTAVTDMTSGLGIEIAGDKEETKQLLAEAHIPVPGGLLISSEEELHSSIARVRYPLVIKPLDGNHGRGVTTNIHDMDKALFGFKIAKKISDTVIVEEFVEGNDYRFLVVNYKLIAVAKRTPAMVTGDGKSTIGELIEKENQDPDRGDTSEHVLAPIRVDDITRKILSEAKLTLDSILAEGQILYLKDTANISAGGTATDVTDTVHPDNVFLAERVARMFNLDICGIDIVAKAVDVPLTRDVGAIIEVNAGPGLRMHSDPTKGEPRNVAAPILDMLFPKGNPRIPIIAVAGRNSDKLTRFIAEIAGNANKKTGYGTQNGMYLQEHLIYEGDSTSYENMQELLFDPTIEIAVLQCRTESIMNSGLGFDLCQTAVLTSVPSDKEELEAISVVPKILHKNGYLVINAEDHDAERLIRSLPCKLALYGNADNQLVREHMEAGGLCAFNNDGHVEVYIASELVFREETCDLEPGINCAPDCALPAVLTGIIHHFPNNAIREAIATYTEQMH